MTTWGVKWYDSPRQGRPGEPGYQDYSDGDEALEERGSNLGKKEYSTLMSLEPEVVSKFRVTAKGLGADLQEPIAGQDSAVSSPLNAVNVPVKAGGQPAGQKGLAVWNSEAAAKVAGRIHSLKHLPGGKMQAESKGEAGKSYVLEGSTNLVNWTPIRVVRPDAEGICRYEDAVADKHPSRFYRIRQR